ncbi:MAG: hypothetical protein WA418_22970 [Bradyrhizobium sp.]
MAVQLMMERSGDSRYPFARASAAEVAETGRHFQRLTSSGFAATARRAPGQVELIGSFDPRVDERGWAAPLK